MMAGNRLDKVLWHSKCLLPAIMLSWQQPSQVMGQLQCQNGQQPLSTLRCCIASTTAMRIRKARPSASCPSLAQTQVRVQIRRYCKHARITGCCLPENISISRRSHGCTQTKDIQQECLLIEPALALLPRDIAELSWQNCWLP